MRSSTPARLLTDVPQEIGDLKNSTRLVKSAARVLRIFELFDVLQTELPVCDVSEMLKLPQSSTSDLLHCMAELGYVYFNPMTRSFGPTSLVALLGVWIAPSMVDKGHLLATLERVAARTRQAVVLSIKNRTSAQTVHAIQGQGSMDRPVVKGSQRPLVHSSAGLVLLADLPDSDIRRIAMRYNAEADSEETKVSFSELMAQTDHVRTHGWVIRLDAERTGMGGIGMPVPLTASNERFAVSVIGRAADIEMNQDEWREILGEEMEAYSLQQMPPAALAADIVGTP